MITQNTQIKGWCPSLEKPMETGDGLLVRVPVKFGRMDAKTARAIAGLSVKYGNGNMDVSARGNLQLRGVSEQAYQPLRAELAKLGFVKDFSLNIITDPFDKKAQKFAETLCSAFNGQHITLPDKFLIVIGGGRVLPLSGLPADMHIDSAHTDVHKIIHNLSKVVKCNKKPASTEEFTSPLGFVPFSEESGVFLAAFPYGRVESDHLMRLAGIVQEFGNGEIRLCPWRMVALSGIAASDAYSVQEKLEELGLIVSPGDSRLYIHACVGAPACSSALGDTRNFARKWVHDNPGNTKTVHITGCTKGCAYRGKADITITATEDGIFHLHEGG